MKRVHNKSGKGNLEQYFILKIESYWGDDSHIDCGIDRQDYLFSIVVIKENRAAIVDNGYQSVKEALKYWPEAIPCES